MRFSAPDNLFVAANAAIEDIRLQKVIARTMNTKPNTESPAFELAGDRLNHLLDQIGFKKGRGRVAEFQNYLSENAPDVFSDLKYTTVRSWFQEHSPPMRKIDAVIKALQSEYTIHENIPQIKTWWKLGGLYPFSGSDENVVESEGRFEDIDEKIQFIVMSLVTEEAGELFQELSGSELVGLKDKVIQFAKDFADPFKTQCPTKYLRMAVKHELIAIQDKVNK